MTTGQGQRVRVSSGVEIAYDATGTGVPLVVLHGAEADRRQFADFAGELGAGVQMLSYDQRDSGETRNGPEPYTMADLGQDLADLVEVLDIGPVVVLGASFGGLIAQHFCLRHPELTAGAVLVATTASAATTRGHAARMAALGPAERSAYLLDAAVSPAARAADPGLLDRLGRLLVTRAPEQHARRTFAMRSHDLADEAAGISTPTLVIHGSDDPVVPLPGGEHLAATIPNAHLEVLDGGRHAVTVEFRSRIAELTTSFIRDLALLDATRSSS